MSIDLSKINYLAVVVAALATFFLGALWYMALFGKLWQRLSGYSDEKIKQMQAAKPPAVFFGGMIVSDLLMAFVIAILATSFKVEGIADGALLGFLLWLGPALGIGITSWLAADTHPGVYVINLSYQLTFLVMMGVIVAAWR